MMTPNKENQPLGATATQISTPSYNFDEMPEMVNMKSITSDISNLKDTVATLKTEIHTIKKWFQI